MTLEQKFGASGQCLYVIAPDGSIVRKSAGLMVEELEQWLDSG